MVPRSREQQLIDIAFELAITCSRYLPSRPPEVVAEWVADQLLQNGFETRPMGLSWGVLVEPTGYNILNHKAKIKDVCHKCKYLNLNGTDFYRCRVQGSCPAALPRDE